MAPPDNATLQRMLRSALGARCRLATYSVAHSRDAYAVLIADVTNPSRRVVVKLAGPGATIACPFDRTAALVRRVRDRTGVPTPDVLAADVSHRDWPWRYLITDYIEGTTWTAAQPVLHAGARRDLYRQLGQAAAQLHTMRFAAYGEIDAGGWVPGNASLVDALMERARRRISNAGRAALFVSLLRDRAHLFDSAPGPALCHEDLNPSNILVRQDDGGWRLAAILDFDSAWAGSPESDLARLELWQSGAYPGLLDGGFRAAYEEAHDLPLSYRERRPIYQLLWCLEYAGASRRHAADTALVCMELGISPLLF